MSPIPNPLPSSPPLSLLLSREAVEAYRVCLKFEKRLVSRYDEEPTKSTISDLTHCRLVGKLFHYYPNYLPASGVEGLIKDIKSCQDNIDKFLYIGYIYNHFFIQVFKSHAGSSALPYSSKHASPHFENVRRSTTVPSGERTNIRSSALHRDDNRCRVTGLPDATAVAKNAPFRNPPPAGSKTVSVECAHIIPLSIGNSRKRAQMSVVCAAFSRLGFESLLTELNGRLGLNGLQNIICMDKELHHHFDSLRLWFVATPTPATPHRYKVMVPQDVSYEKLQIQTNYVEFGTPDQATYPAPSPKYLKVHALSCMLAEELGITRLRPKA